MKSIILTSSSEAFYTALEKLFLKTAEAGIEDTDYGMEGPIVYFVVPEPDKNGIGRQITVGAGNLKTLEYRFFSRIR